MVDVAKIAPTADERVLVSEDEYLEHYAEQGYEWVQGELIKVAAGNLEHHDEVNYLLFLLNAYLTLNPIGRVLGESFLLRMTALQANREPELMVVLNDGVGKLTETAVIGAADICIEVISPESVEWDYRVKYLQYEAAGVREYWIIDPAHKRASFNRRDESGIYAPQEPDDRGNYTTPLLPKLVLHVPTLWEEKLPNIFEVGNAVKKMMESP